MKKGFTLVEIIICIALISLIGIGTTIFIIKSNNQKELDILEKNKTYFDNALEVYLLNHNEVINNINNNVEGAIVSLELLKNEGLINSGLNINYKDNYYVVTNAFLGNKNLEGNIVKEECENSIGLEKVASWAKDNNTNSVLYFCPKEDDSGGATSIEIEDPYEDCTSNDERLYCQIIKNAKNTVEIYSDLTETNIIEGDSSKITSFNNEYTVYREKPLTDIGEVPMILSRTNNKAFIVMNDTTNYTIGSNFGISLNAFTSFSQFSFFQVDDNYKVIINSNGNRELTLENKKDWSYGSSDYAYSDDDYFKNLNYEQIKSFEGKYLIFKTGGRTATASGIYSPLIKFLSVNDLGNNKLQINYLAFFGGYIDDFYDMDIEKTMAKTEDEFGYSYYFRGNIKDNYVSFNNMCWRVVRIEGDGSIKLILESKYNNCETINKGSLINNKIINDEKEEYGYIGGWSNSSGGAMNYNYGLGIRYSLLDWFDQNFDDIDKNYLKSEKFCLGNLTLKNKITDRYEYIATYNGTPELKCHDSDFLKTLNDYVTTLTVDEAYFAGLHKTFNWGYYSYLNQESNYCNFWRTKKSSVYNQCNENFTLTATNKSIYFIGYNGVIKTGSYDPNLTYGTRVVRPVIVLKNDVKFDSGRGTLSNPYQIKLSLD